MNSKLSKVTLALMPLVLSTVVQASDPLYDQQWHLNNTGQNSFSQNPGVPGNDMKAQAAHEMGASGKGIKISVLDTGVQIDHIDLVANVVPGSQNLVTGTDYPNDSNGHGTAVAGLIAAVGWNNEGVRGVAPSAGINGYNFLSNQSTDAWLESHGKGKGSEDTHIFNQSYGSSTIWPVNYDPENNPEQALTESTMQDVTLNSLSGRGATYVKSAGNGYRFFRIGNFFILPGDFFSSPVPNQGLPMENSNTEISDANFWNTVVSAISADGKRSSYSSVSSAVFMTAPGGEFGTVNPAMVTIDLMGCDAGFNNAGGLGSNDLHGGTAFDPECNYNSVMNGTSSAAPNMSGAIATVMSANSRLTPRDAKHLLAQTATKTDPDNQGITLTFNDVNGNTVDYAAIDGWKRNSAGYHYHLFYGLGRPNIEAAVRLAQGRDEDDDDDDDDDNDEDIKLPPLQISNWVSQAENIEIPDASLVGGTSSQSVELDDFTVEGVQLKVDIDHARLNDLSIELISPSGTRSVLMTARNALYGQSFSDATGFTNQLMLSTHFYGEEAEGQWTLKVVDTAGDDSNRDWLLFSDGNASRIALPNNDTPGIIKNWSLRFFGHEED